MTTADCSVIVVAGGTARRFGSDKLAAPFAGSTLLDEVVRSVASVNPGAPIICVGPARALSTPVLWAREDPPGGGPAAGICAGLDLISTEFVAVIGGDMPYAAAAIPALIAGAADGDGAIAHTPDGRAQWLLVVVRTERLRATRQDAADGIPVRSLWNRLDLRAVAIDTAHAADVDTPADLARMISSTNSPTEQETS